ncbi:hypothetical protein BMF94_2125 [Rhodotorula taiwanensis]|uniref:Uncharacterized protein n=1 Tax=Rhodotorula taiwanensis TaxID=741276 RepID=A0A2S5BDK0_9BASI|nr:hypothetical protein BMF94_2125 [Rhodotorula taiwanensis]
MPMMTKEEPRSPYLPPTPSPSPPTHRHTKLFGSPPSGAAEAEAADSKTPHLARAHTAASQVQLDLLSRAQLGTSGGLTGPRHVIDSSGNQLLRYTLEVEAIERGTVVKKRVSVLFPRRPPLHPAPASARHSLQPSLLDLPSPALSRSSRRQDDSRPFARPFRLFAWLLGRLSSNLHSNLGTVRPQLERRNRCDPSRSGSRPGLASGRKNVRSGNA